MLLEFPTFAETINPERVHFINAAVHYDERPKQTALDAFISRVQTLRMHGFHVLVSLVMTPVLVRDFPELARTKRRKLRLAPPKGDLFP
jgi:hypothetical protein